LRNFLVAKALTNFQDVFPAGQKGFDAQGVEMLAAPFFQKRQASSSDQARL